MMLWNCDAILLTECDKNTKIMKNEEEEEEWNRESKHVPVRWLLHFPHLLDSDLLDIILHQNWALLKLSSWTLTFFQLVTPKIDEFISLVCSLLKKIRCNTMTAIDDDVIFHCTQFTNDRTTVSIFLCSHSLFLFLSLSLPLLSLCVLYRICSAIVITERKRAHDKTH